jgi:Family of unknown function (DUF6092)
MITEDNAARLDQRTAVELLCHLAASAELCVSEPVHYGTFRLLDAASRLSAALLAGGLDDPWLRDLQRDIDEKKVLMMHDRDAYFAFLPQVSCRLAEHLREIADQHGEEGEGRVE